MWQGSAPRGLPGRAAPRPWKEVLSPGLGEEERCHQGPGASGLAPLHNAAAEPAPGLAQVKQHVPGPGPQGPDWPGKDPTPEVRELG